MSGELQTNAMVNELATLLIPICGRQLVLPNVSVAEVIPYTESESIDDTPNWFVGRFTWRNTDVPLVSFEAINDEPFTTTNKHKRIAVLNGLLEDSRLPFCGILTEGMPRLMRVMSDEVAIDEDFEPGPAELSRVLVSGEHAAIPNIDYILQEILNLL
ncbi:MAG: chemotaxis protein CheW [Spongiibacteraceae bacterium]|nr:chemotaxis protein CheW [Spongiibacteraceae bacterium]